MIPGIVAGGMRRGVIPPPVDPYWNNVGSLLYFNNNLNDEKSNVWTSSGTPVYADGGLNTSTAFISSPNAAWNNLAYGQGDYTVEMFITQTAANGTSGLFSHSYPGAGNAIPLAIAFGKIGTATSSNQLYFGLFASNTWVGANSTWSPTTGIRHHIAAVREGNVYRLFADGVQIATFTSAAVATSTQPIRIGARWDPSITAALRFQGVISNPRVTKGVVRYVAPFTPPTPPFPNQ